jgi:hypothetical protein
MTERERIAVLVALETTRDAFASCVAALSDAQAHFQPSPERWSVLGIVEHVAVAEHGMYRFITALHEVSEDPHEEESALSLQRANDRKANPLAAPERAHPKKKFESLDAALQQFLTNRARTIEFVQNCRDDLRCRLIHHPVGLLNGQDCLLLLSHHPARHIDQINELKADPALPE